MNGRATIKKYRRTKPSRYSFSVLIPTWNNLQHLTLCIQSLLKNSHHELQIIVFVNEGSDGTIEWLEQQEQIDYIHSTQNVGICYGVNACRSLVQSDYIVYLNDDMYVLPDWDLMLKKEIEQIQTKDFMLSATMIEPVNTGNPCVVVGNYGQQPEQFQEERLLDEYHRLKRTDWNGSTWPPNVVHRDVWDLVGGLSIEFSPGMYSDPDFSKKLYEAGVRIFKGVGSSLVYHFGSASTGRIKRNNGRNTFLSKWGITSKTFTKKYLRIGEPYQRLPEKQSISTWDRWLNTIKKMVRTI